MSLDYIKKRIAKKKAAFVREAELKSIYPEFLASIEKENGSAQKTLENLRQVLSQHEGRFTEQVRMIDELSDKIERVKVIKGEKGDTPKRGKDYFTENDIRDFKNSIVNIVLSILPEQKDYPTQEEIIDLIKPFVENRIKEYEKKKAEFTEKFKDLPDLKTLEKLIEKIASAYVKKNQGYTGGGANYFFDLNDTPDKQTKFGKPYQGQSGKVVKVKTDETGLEFGTGGSGSSISVNSVEVTDPDFLDSAEIEFGVSGSDVTLSIATGSIDVLKLDAGVQTSLGLADTAVQGPASATDNAIARFDGTTGKLIQNSVVTIADTTGNMAGVGTLNTHTIPGGTGTIALTSDLDDYVPYNDANQDILPTDDTVSLGSLISEKRFKHLHTSGVKIESEFTSTGAASAFGFTLSAVIGQTIGVTEELSNGVLTFGRTTTGNVQQAGSRVWLHTLNPVFYSIQRFNSITDNQHIWGFMTTGTDISDIQGIYFAKLTGETNIQARVRDGSGTQTTDTGVAVVDATMQEFLIQVTSGRARFYINGVEVADISSNVPTAHLKWLWRIETSNTGTKTFGLDYAKIYQNRT